MPLAQQTEMTTEEIDAFLGRHETGVLSLARGDEPYSIPISYGYDPVDHAFYFRLVSTPKSEKREFLSSEPAARLVVYSEVEDTDDKTDDTYRSVVASGVIEAIAPEALTVDRIEQYGSAKRPLFEIWGRSKDNLDIELYEFQPTSLTGHRTDIDRTLD